MDETPRNWLPALLLRHPALLASGVYVLASTIGMLYSWDYLRLFGINVFNYAQIGDFLLASLKEPFTWLIVVISVLLVLADNALSRYVQRNSERRFLRWYGSGRYRMLNYVLAMLLVVLFMHAFAQIKKKQVDDGQVRLVNVRLADSAEIRNVALLGTTTQFVFLYDVRTGRVDIHPNESVHAISFTLEKDQD